MHGVVFVPWLECEKHFSRESGFWMEEEIEYGVR